MVNRHPMYVVYVDLNPGLVDVNIHPHKAEVRFSEERDLVLLLSSCVKGALDSTFLVPTMALRPSPNEPLVVDKSQQSTLELIQNPSKSVSSSSAGWSYPPGVGAAAVGKHPTTSNPRVPFRQPTGKIPSEAVDTVMGRVQNETQTLYSSATHEGEPSEMVVKERERVMLPTVESIPSVWRLQPIGQALGMYIVADDGEQLYIIDQHAAHERILFEKFTKRLDESNIGQIPLLTPFTMTLAPVHHAIVFANVESFDEMGIVIEEFGGFDIVVRTIPDIWEGLDCEKLLDQLIHDAAESRTSVDVRAFLRDEVVMRACKAAIKANHRLSADEIKALCDAMSDLQDPFHCPHGRPIVIKLSSHDLEKEFRRIV